ncbi:MAG: hypothetical protein MUF34_15910, partial [Polyangiaceae bacterium]|nr:hypothetical protein [Polyangiaceae bacterium]
GAWVVGGASVAFAGAGAVLVAKGLSQRAELKRCEVAATCDGREVAAASNLNVALGGVAGGLALAGAGAAIWLAFGPASRPSAKASAAGLMLGPAGAQWRGVF